MLRVVFDVTNLVKWGQRQARMPARIKSAAARSLNHVGGEAVDRMVSRIARESGLPEHTVRGKFAVERASPEKLTFAIKASRTLMVEKSDRPLPGRQRARRADSFFHDDELVNIVTMEDNKVCPLCEALAEGNPYSIEEARAQIPHHINCRCLVEPMRHRREVPVEFRPRRHGGDMIESLNMRELVEHLSKELRVELKAV